MYTFNNNFYHYFNIMHSARNAVLSLRHKTVFQVNCVIYYITLCLYLNISILQKYFLSQWWHVSPVQQFHLRTLYAQNFNQRYKKHIILLSQNNFLHGHWIHCRTVIYVFICLGFYHHVFIFLGFYHLKKVFTTLWQCCF